MVIDTGLDEIGSVRALSSAAHVSGPVAPELAGDLLFPTRQGKRLTTDNLSHAFVTLTNRVGIYVNAHLLRHSAATRWAEQGGSIAILQRILGHASLQTTPKYIHVPDSAIWDAHAKCKRDIG